MNLNDKQKKILMSLGNSNSSLTTKEISSDTGITSPYDYFNSLKELDLVKRGTAEDSVRGKPVMTWQLTDKGHDKFSQLIGTHKAAAEEIKEKNVEDIKAVEAIDDSDDLVTIAMRDLVNAIVRSLPEQPKPYKIENFDEKRGALVELINIVKPELAGVLRTIAQDLLIINERR